MKKAIILGASSGIGRELAKTLAADGWAVGLAARRLPLLMELRQEIGGGEHGSTIVVKQIDVSDPVGAMTGLSKLTEEMDGVDLIVISAGTGFINPDLEWGQEHETIAVNVVGFTAIAGVAMNYFIARGQGHLANISSIAALRGSGAAPAYNASKAFESNYLQGLRQKIAKLRLPITITDIQPGFVDTAMAKGDGLFWVAPSEKAAAQIYRAIRRKKKHAYVSRRWRLIAWLFKFLPDSIYNRL